MLGLRKKQQEKEDYEYFFANGCIKVVSDEPLNKFEEETLRKKKIFVKKTFDSSSYVDSNDFIELEQFVNEYLVTEDMGKGIESKNNKGLLVFDSVKEMVRKCYPDFVINLIKEIQKDIQEKKKNLLDESEELFKHIQGNFYNGKTNKS